MKGSAEGEVEAEQAQEGAAPGQESKAGRTGQNSDKDPEEKAGVQGEAQRSSAARARHGEGPQERAGTIPGANDTCER